MRILITGITGFVSSYFLDYLNTVEPGAEVMGIDTVVNPQLIRPNENRKITGSYQKMKKDFGWEPEISLEQSLNAIINY